MPKRKNIKDASIFSGLMNQDEDYIWVTEFDDDSLHEFYSKFKELEEDPSIQIIPIIISSYGGEVHVVLAMRDLIKSSQKPVATICLGKAMSAGASLLAAGTPGFRFAGPDAYVMVHEMSAGVGGKASDIQEEAKLTAEMQNRLFDRLAQDIGRTRQELEAQIAKKRNSDWTMTASEAKKWGFIDHIEVPRITSLPPFNTLATDVDLNKNSKPKAKGKKT